MDNLFNLISSFCANLFLFPLPHTLSLLPQICFQTFSGTPGSFSQILFIPTSISLFFSILFHNIRYAWISRLWEDGSTWSSGTAGSTRNPRPSWYLGITWEAGSLQSLRLLQRFSRRVQPQGPPNKGPHVLEREGEKEQGDARARHLSEDEAARFTTKT